jgi:hypothetical protein
MSDVKPTSTTKDIQSVSEKSQITPVPSIPSTVEKGKESASKKPTAKELSKYQLKLTALKLHIILTRLNKCTFSISLHNTFNN